MKPEIRCTYQVLQMLFFVSQGRTGVHKPCLHMIPPFYDVSNSYSSCCAAIVHLNNRESIQSESFTDNPIHLSWYDSEILWTFRALMTMNFFAMQTQTSLDDKKYFQHFPQEDIVESTLGKYILTSKERCTCNTSASLAYERHHNHLNVKNLLEEEKPFCEFCDMYRFDRKRRHFAYVLLTHQPESSRSFSPHIARRIGEALHPGPTRSPECCHTKLVFVNPTAVNKKVSTLLEIQPDVICLAETSATLLVQQAVTSEFRSKDFTSLWSPPVSPHAATTREEAAFRGEATGVSMHSNLPIRSSRIDIPTDIDPLRLVTGILEIGPLYVHLITIYGYPKPHRDAFIKTDQLLTAAARLADAVGLPAIIVGDFNHAPEKLYAGRALMQYGYQTTANWYEKLYHEKMPNTCREATCNDQAFLHPDLLPFVNSLKVNKTKAFGDHDPVELTLDIPFRRPCKQIFRTPKTWMHFEPDKNIVATHFQEFAKENNLPLDAIDDTIHPDALKLWAKGIEVAVQKTIVEQHQMDPEKFPQKHLPKECLGRDKDPKIVKITPKVPIAKACAGQYTPPAEVVTFRIKMTTRQVRRMQSLKNRLAKLHLVVNHSNDMTQSLRDEWRAIINAKGFCPTFPSYCLSHSRIFFYPLDFPTIEWLERVIDVLTQDIEQEIVIERKKHRETSKFELWYDEKKNHLQNTIKQVKQISNPTLTVVASEQKTMAKLQEDDFGLVTLLLQSSCTFRHDRLITYGDLKAQIQTAHDKKLVVMFVEHYDSLPEQAFVCQTDLTNDPMKVADKLSEFWNKFWCRDTVNDVQSLDSWTHFQQQLEQCPKQPIMQLDLCNVELWKKAIATTKIKSAKGTDGWSVEELRSLPDVCIQVLANIFASLQGKSFPKEWSNSITIPIGKNNNPESPAQTRPITLIPMLYRWWTKVVTKQILQHWGQVAPAGLIGFLPTRSAQLELMDTQWQFEKAHDQNIQQDLAWQGLTLDLVKCFNLLPRRPSYNAMKHLGVPIGILDIWFNTLENNNRWWKIHNQIWSCGLSTTGAPEGDSWSIIACLSLSWVWQHHIALTMAKPTSYADNWGWKTTSTRSNLAAIRTTISYTNSLKLQIDWEKTWAWTTQSTGKKKWEQELKFALPELQDLTIVTHARELGYMIHYNKVTSRETQMQRHLEALAQLRKLKRIPISLDSKALLTTYAMHKALYGTETYAVGQNWTKELRSAMAKAIVPYKQSSNPHLAVMMLSKLVIDPELYLIRQSLVLCRKLLMQLSVEDQNTFQMQVAKHSGDHRYVRGPAGAFKFNLQRIGWSFAANGMLYTDTIVTFHILRDSIIDILKFVEYSWLKNMTQINMTREIWRNFPVPDRAATIRIISKLNQTEQKIASQAITGANMMSTQSQHFTERDNTCDLCDEEDSTEHRLMHCQQTRHLCNDFTDLILFLQEHHPCHYEIPVVYLADDFEFNWFFLQNRPDPCISEDVINNINQMQQQGKPIILFTDGSCTRPTHQWHRRAAYAVVLANRVDKNNFKDDIDAHKSTGVIPSTFTTIAVAECVGAQSIPRAELQAIACAAKLGVKVIVYTDSQYAIDILDALRTTVHPRHIAGVANFDILLPLWESGDWRNLELRKVKSHELYKQGDTLETTWQKLGNEAADLAAKSALTKFITLMPMHTDFEHHEASKKFLVEQIGLRSKQQVERAKCFELQQQQKQLPTSALNFQPQIHELIQWQPNNTWTPSVPNNPEALKLCTWTTEYGEALLHWLQQLKWPLEPDGVHDITWFEMTFAFQTYLQTGIVYNSGGQGRFFMPAWASRDDDNVRYGKQVLAFERCVGQLQKLTSMQLVPTRKSNCSTIMVLGANHYRPGLASRPIYPWQQQVTEALYNHFAKLKLDQKLVGPPTIPQVPIQFRTYQYECDTEDFQRGWHHRVNRQRLFLRQLER